MALSDRAEPTLLKSESWISPWGVLAAQLTAALLSSAHLAQFLQELLSSSSSQLNNRRLLSDSLPCHSPPPSLTLRHAQHGARGQWTQFKCHKKPLRVPKVSSRQKALSFFLSTLLLKCCSLPLLSAPPGRRNASQNEWRKCSLCRHRNVWPLLEVFPCQE